MTADTEFIPFLITTEGTEVTFVENQLLCALCVLCGGFIIYPRAERHVYPGLVGL